MAAVFAVANQKGGVGKTTTALSLAASLAALGHNVLVIDVDPHASASIHLAYYPETVTGSALDIFREDLDDAHLWQAIIKQRASHGFDFVPSHTQLSDVEQDLGNRSGKGMILRQRLAHIAPRYDYIVIDCPPQMSVVLVNCLVAADVVLVPMQTDFLALHGLKLLFATLGTLERGLGRPIRVKVLATMFDRRANACNRVLDLLQSKLGPRMCATVINIDTKFREASARGLVITDFAPTSRGALEYLELARELVQMEGA